MRFIALLQVTLYVLTASSIFVFPISAQTDNTQVTVEPYRSTNVRSGPGVTYEVIAELQQGQMVEATGRSDLFSNWLQINLGTQRGWVAYFTVAVQGDIDTLPLIQIADATPVIAPTTSLSRTNATTDLYATAYRQVNVRSGPGTDFSVIGVLAPGQTADVIGTSGEAHEWLQIDLNGEPGWVAYFVVTVTGDLEDLVNATAVEALEVERPDNETLNAIVINQVIVITRFNTNLREQPVLGARVINIVPYESTLQATARTLDSRWLQVSYGDSVGWLITSLVNSGVSDIDSLPTVDPPSIDNTPPSPEEN